MAIFKLYTRKYVANDNTATVVVTQ